MRLILLSTEFPPGPGGIGVHAYQLARHLSDFDWKIFVVTPQDYIEKNIIQFNKSQPFRIVRLKPKTHILSKFFYRWSVGSDAIKRWNPELILASGDRMIYLSAILAKYHKRPLVVIEHGRIPASPIEKMIKRWSFNQADMVISVSQYTERKLANQGIHPMNSYVINNGADETQFRVLPETEIKRFRRTSGLDDANILLTVGNVTERKGQLSVIRTLPRILEKAPNTHYLMAGLPTKKMEFAKIANDLNVRNHIHFLGVVPNDRLVRLMNCCDVFIMTSRHTREEFEGFGIAVVEAALCGKPAVVTTNSGLTEAISDGETGFAVPEDDDEATSRAILKIILNRGIKESMGKKACQYALDKQTWKSRVKEYNTLLTTVLYSASA